MSSRLTSREARDLLTRAIEGIELRSSAEVVLAIRGQSGTFRHADLLGAIVGGLAALVFVLFSPWPYHTWQLLVFPLLAGIAAFMVTASVPALRRALAPARDVALAVDHAARATFFDKSIGLTRRATGVLVYISLLERQVRVLPDRAITEHVPQELWQRGVEALTRAVRQPDSPASLGNALEQLGNALAAGLPRSDDDVNELPDEPDVEGVA